MMETTPEHEEKIGPPAYAINPPNQPPQQPYPNQPYHPQQQPYPPQQQPYPHQQQPYPPQQQPYPSQQPYPQQPAYVYTTGQTPQVGQPVTVVYNRPTLNFTGAIIFSCVVFWCCGWIFGLIAFVLAMIGQSTASDGNESSAKSLLTASYILSTIGLVVGIILFIVIIVLSVNTKNCSYDSYGVYRCPT